MAICNLQVDSPHSQVSDLVHCYLRVRGGRPWHWMSLLRQISLSIIQLNSIILDYRMRWLTAFSTLFSICSSLAAHICSSKYMYINFWIKCNFTEVLRTPGYIRSGFKVMTFRSWQYISCHWETCSNHLAISDFHFCHSFKVILFSCFVKVIKWACSPILTQNPSIRSDFHVGRVGDSQANGRRLESHQRWPSWEVDRPWPVLQAM